MLYPCIILPCPAPCYFVSLGVRHICRILMDEWRCANELTDKIRVKINWCVFFITYSRHCLMLARVRWTPRSIWTFPLDPKLRKKGQFEQDSNTWKFKWLCNSNKIFAYFSFKLGSVDCNVYVLDYNLFINCKESCGGFIQLRLKDSWGQGVKIYAIC